jgi:hypothetical protein
MAKRIRPATGRMLYEVECRNKKGELPPEQELLVLADSLDDSITKAEKFLRGRYVPSAGYRVLGVREVGTIDAE